MFTFYSVLDVLSCVLSLSVVYITLYVTRWFFCH